MLFNNRFKHYFKNYLREQLFSSIAFFEGAKYTDFSNTNLISN